MDEELLLLNPGPVPVAPAVRRAMSAPMVSHRSAAFEAIYRRARAGIEHVFEHGTPDGSSTSAGGSALLLNGTATMAMEAVVSNLVTPDDTVVSLVNGKFGRRFARLGDRYAHGRRVEADWGGSFDLDAVREAITDDTDLVTMVHNETSTGLLNPVAAVGAIADEHDARFVVDGVTSIGGDEFRVDDWGVDVAVVGSQKALAAPPGLSAVYVADRAADALDGGRGPLYHDLDRHRQKADQDQTPFTSAVPLFRALDAAIALIREEGLPERIARHRRYAGAFRAGFDALGLDRFAEPEGPSAYSNTVTAVALPAPARTAGDAFFEAVLSRGVSISGGQGHLGGEILRVSNMGTLASDDIVRGIRAIAEALVEVGMDVPVDDGVAAATAHL